MNRELTFSINDIDKIYVTSDTFVGYYDGKRLYAGQSGEDEATRLTFKFGADFVGYAISVKFDGTAVKTPTLAAGSMEFYYDIPDTYMVPEVIKMLIEATLSGQTFKSQMVRLEVKR